MLGGSPLRLFRLTAGGRQLFDEIAAGDTGRAVAAHRAAARGRSDPPGPSAAERVDRAPLRTGRRHGRRADPRDRAGPRVRHPPPLPRHGRRDVRRRRLGHPADRRARRRRWCACATTPVRRRPATPASAPPRRRSLRSSTPTSTSIPGGSTACSGTSTTPRVGFVAPRVASGPAVDGGDDGSPGTSNATPRSTSAPSRRRIVAGTRVSYVPAAALLVRKHALDEIGGFDATLRCRRGRRRRVAAGRGRMARPLRTGGRRPPPAPARPGVQLAVQRRAYGESAAALAARHGNAVAPVRMSPWSFGVWGLAAAGRPFTAAGVAGAHGVGAGPQAARRARRASRCASPATGHLAAGGSLATAVRRVWLPLVGLGAVWSRRGALGRRRGNRAGDHPRRTCPTARRRRPTASVCGRACSGGDDWRRCCPPSPRGPSRTTSFRRSGAVSAVAGRRLDPPPHGRSGGVAGPRRTRRRVVLGGGADCVVPVVKGNGYGFGRTVLARVADDLVATPRRGDGRRSSRSGPCTSSPACHRGCVLSCSRPPARPLHRRLRSAPRQPDRHDRRQRPRRCARRLARRGARQAGILDAPVRCGAPRAGRLRDRTARTAGLTVIGYSIHLPLAGDDAERVAEVERWLAVLDTRHQASDSRARCG